MRSLPLGYVERMIGAEYRDVLAGVASSAEHTALQEQACSDGWPDPAEPIAVCQEHGGRWGLVSGAVQFTVAAVLGLTHIEVLILRPSEVAAWQTALNRQAPKVDEPEQSEDDFYLTVASYYADPER